MKAELKDVLEFLYTDSKVSEKKCRSMDLSAARGGFISVNILLNGLKKGEKVSLSLSSNGKKVPGAEWSRLIDVPVEENTGLKGFLEDKKNKKSINKFVARRAPFRVYDAMEPVGRSVKVKTEIMALRLDIPIKKDSPTGRKVYTLEVSSGKEAYSFTVNARVYKAVIPPVGEKSFPYTNWFTLNYFALRHGYKPWSAGHKKMIKKYAELMAKGRQNAFLLNDIFEMKGRVPVLNKERLHWLVKTFTDAGIYYIEGGHVAGRTGGKWMAKTFDLALKPGVLATSPEGNLILASALKQLLAEIKKNKWEKRWIQHVADEPHHDCVPDYRILVGMVRKYMPGITIMDATMDPGLVGSVDIWCPQNFEYEAHRKELEAQRAVGDKIWYYTCCVPGGNWLNRLTDMELIRVPLLGWAGELYELDGFLHWGLNNDSMDRDPFKNGIVKIPGAWLPAGDTHIVYPGRNDEAWSSVRFEAQREGFEDLELLRLLKKKNRKKAEKIIKSVVRSFKNYTKDVKKLRAAREKLLASL